MKTTGKTLFRILTIILALSAQAQAQSFTNTGPLNVGRGNQTATLLQNGNVLVAGGTTNGANGINPPTDSAEIYVPASGTWTNVGAMAVARYAHTATLLPNGKVLVADGVGISNNYADLASAELFDPVSGLWTVTGTPNDARHGHTATLLSNGMVLIAGGYDGTNALGSAELYDPDTQAWTYTGNLNFPRGHQAAALLPNGEVLVAGGDGTNWFSSAELYDPVAGTWALTSAMSVARSGATATLLPDGTVLFAGGGSAPGPDYTLSSAEIYSYGPGTWQLVGSMNVPRWGAMATLLASGNVLVAGGLNGTNAANTYLASAESYNPLTKAWTIVGLMWVAREGGTATLLDDGQALIAGGSDGVIYLSSAELYVPMSVSTQPQSLVVNAHSTASFSVVVSGTAPFSYQWSFDGTNIPGATASSLTISNVVQTNLGTYSVVVTNALDAVTSSNAVLSMYPYLAAPFGGLDTYWGYTNTLSVGAWGTGPLDYQWFDDGNAIDGATNQTLTLTGVQFTNAGLYTVVVTSPLGSVTNTPEQVVVNPAGVSFGGLYPSVIIQGVVGYNYVIQSTANLSDTNSWVTVTNLTLTQPIQLWIDSNTDASLPANPNRFYQVLPGQ